LTVEDVFVIRNRGVVATGRVESGLLRVGETVHIEIFRKSIHAAKAGDNIGVLFKSVGKGQLDRGSVLTASGEFPSIEQTGFVV
jgi:elongation factor Tu